ncbi:hypothetical protein H0A36_19610 [Endozoicomonas sp. SM1973]|uniref:Uncharacterized protein n=1 Tax=Spartinivicinus marinus TaxID=2994442 RepID=A0A853I662_9GAMM|nr:hypothetical protein [Spartinivicinus marinus]MCX4027951.1 hypothetical protein [Spartinivicinus marinus]NYZ68229.1 hypothetical protein [Spartinivicinus marinus]
MKLPDIERKHVIQFCSGLSDALPVKIPLRPLKDADQRDCFNILSEHVAEHGGSQLFGWSIWEWPSVMIEAEFHSVWKNDAGEIIDLTPKPKYFEYTIFVHDSSKVYQGRQVNNIRKPIAKGLTTKKYIETADEIYAEMNKGDLANYHGELEATPKLMRLHQKMADLQRKLMKKHGSPN